MIATTYEIKDLESDFETLSKLNKAGTTRYLAVPSLPGDFWGLWKQAKDEIKTLGFWVSKMDGDFFVFRQDNPQRFESPPTKIETVSDLPDLGDLTQILKPHQIEHTQYVIAGLKRQNYFLDTSGTGSGKTYIALCAVKFFNLKTLAIVPAAVVSDWIKAAKAVGVDHLVEVVSLEKARKGSTVIKLNGDKKSPQVFDFPPPSELPFVIFDEVHKCGGHKTLQSSLLVDCADNLRDRKILMLSATAADSPLKMRGLGFILELFSKNTYASWLSWAKNHGVVESDYGLEFAKPRLFKNVYPAIFPKRSHRIADKLLMQFFPGGQVLAEAVEGDPEMLSEYKNALDIYITRLKQEAEADMTGSVLSAQIRARQHSELAKLKPIIDMTEDFLLEGKSVVVFLNFLDSINVLKEHFQKNDVEYRLSDGTIKKGKIPLAEIVGGQSVSERNKAKDDFQSDKARLVLVTLQAGGTGISLHDLHGNYPRASITSPSFNAVDLKQALGRIPRTGGQSPVIQKILFLKATIEESICKRIQTKLDSIDTFNEGDLNPALFKTDD